MIEISTLILFLNFNCFIPPDIDECAANTHNCHSNADCTNTNGAFTCTCKSGFTASGTTCSGE